MLVFFTCSTVVSANTTLDKLTQDDGITALKAGDELGFEVLSRAELESVRGEEAKIFFVNIITGAIIGTAAMSSIYGGEYCVTCGGKWSVFIPWFLKPIKAY